MADTINLDELRRIGAETGFSSKLLEKDYHLTKILHRISEQKIKDIVFKGGTCLNKCYLGFYRLSEDLDFVYNQDVKGKTKLQIKKILDGLRRELFGILNEMEFKTSKELGKGWKMLTSTEDPKIVGLEVITNYNSLIEQSNKLFNPYSLIKRFDISITFSFGEPVLNIIAKSSESLRASGPCLRNLSLGLFCSGRSLIFINM